MKKSNKHQEGQKVLVGVITLVVFLLMLQIGSCDGPNKAFKRTFSNILGDPTTTSSASVANSAPVASSAVLNYDGGAGGGAITLLSNTTHQINATVTVTDNNGCSDISSVSAALFVSNGTSATTHISNATASLNNRTFYNVTCASASTCTAGGADLTDVFNCSFTIIYYASPTDINANISFRNANWTINVTPFDATGIGNTTTSSQEVSTLTSIGVVTSNVSFGALSLGQNTSTTNTNMTVQNLGNVQLDVQLDVFGAVDGDAEAMNCTTGNITNGFMRYANNTFDWDNTSSHTNASDTATELELNVKQASDGAHRPSGNVLWGLGIPPVGAGGNCRGTITVTALNDASAD